MYATILAVVGLLASTAVAQGTQGLPQCATSCLGGGFGSCSRLDVKCICQSSDLIANLACCVGKTCSAADIEATTRFADALCGNYGVTGLPTAATCASTSGPTSSATSGGSSSSSSAAANTSSAPSSAGTSAASASSASSSSATSGSSTSSASTSKVSAAATNAAAPVYKAEGLGYGLAALGFLAAL